jgi:hypothetical protein
LAIGGSTIALGLSPGKQAPLTTARCPFLALVISSSEPGVKSMMPSLPGPPANVMLEGRKHMRTFSQRQTPYGGALPCAQVQIAHSPPVSPALVDVDIVHSIGAEGSLGQCLNHVVTLQHHISLGGQVEGEVKPSSEPEDSLHLLSLKGAPSAYCPHAAHEAQTGCHSGC